MQTYETRPLTELTWPDFARLVDANNGVWGGCWCMWYHGKAESQGTPVSRKKAKACRVRAGRAHASLVYADGECVGWCQFGSSKESPRIHNEKSYIEGYPENTEGRKASPAFLFNGALSTFEQKVFKRSRQIGKHKWVVTRTVRKPRARSSAR